MNRKAFLALLARDAHVARRNLGPLILQTFLQPCCSCLFSAA
jgi:hypothetical protein